MKTRVFIPTGFFSRWMRRRGWAGVTLPVPWFGAVVVMWGEPSRTELDHELVHVRQIERMGPAWFAFKYFCWLLRYGYAKHPLEIEARELARGNIGWTEYLQSYDA